MENLMSFSLYQPFFSYRWAAEGIQLEVRLGILHRSFSYFVGFGLPLTIVSSPFGFFVSDAIYSLLFPAVFFFSFRLVSLLCTSFSFSVSAYRKVFLWETSSSLIRIFFFFLVSLLLITVLDLEYLRSSTDPPKWWQASLYSRISTSFVSDQSIRYVRVPEAKCNGIHFDDVGIPWEERRRGSEWSRRVTSIHRFSMTRKMNKVYFSFCLSSSCPSPCFWVFP